VKIDDLSNFASNKNNFLDIQAYLDFSCRYLEWSLTGIQAVIVCQNETQYKFWQYKEDGHYNISRPINSDIMYSYEDMLSVKENFVDLMSSKERLRSASEAEKNIIKRVIYTTQQSIGAALDGLPAGRSNNARKVNGDLFERLIQILFVNMSIDCTSGIVKIPIIVDEIEQCKMSYQHDLIIKNDNEVKAIGSVKTSSKDRIDKVFIDKFLFSQLTEKEVPHIAIFLNDVQRGAEKDRSYRVSSTFLPGHFKGYSIKLNPLDGVYYCDIRPNMISDEFLSRHIKTIDNLFCDDIWKLLNRSGSVKADVQEDENTNDILKNG
jgi:hypothetical protein